MRTALAGIAPTALPGVVPGLGDNGWFNFPAPAAAPPIPRGTSTWTPTAGALHDVQGAGATALRPFQLAAERVARPFRDVYGYFSGLANAKSENAKLHAELTNAQSAEGENEQPSWAPPSLEQWPQDVG